MPPLFNISKAASLALHAAAVLGDANSPVGAARMAEMLDVSQAHLSKVLARLVKFGLISARSGPGGGFELVRSGGEITLKEIYEAVEGPIDASSCPFAVSVCDGGVCALEDEFKRAGERLLAYMAQAHLSDIRIDYEPVAAAGGKKNDDEASS